MHRAPRADARPFAFAALGLLCGACPDPNTFTAPRTVPVGQVSHTISLEAMGVRDRSDYPYVVPLLPSYALRVGLDDRIDTGVHVSNGSALGADFKWNPVRSRVFDLALDPGARVSYTTGVFPFYLHAPVIVGLNLSQKASFLLTSGVSVMGPPVPVGGTEVYVEGHLLWRAGVGFDFRPKPGVAFHPEVTLLVPFRGGGYALFPGIAWSFGSLPSYDD